LIGSANATLSVAKATTYIDYRSAGVSIFKITDAGILPNYRISTSTAAGAAIEFGSSYTYGEAIELRYKVTNWTGIGSSFKALYLRSEAALGGAYGLRCAEFYVVMNTSTTTGLTAGMVGIYSELCVKASASNRTLTGTYPASIEANISIENQTGTLTLTNNIYCLYAKAQTGTGINDYTKVNGIKIAGRNDGVAKVYGIALDISDPEATVCSWTKGISITTACTTAISIDGTMTKGIYIEPSAITYGLLIGTPSTSAGSGLRIGTAYSAIGAPVGIYFDDGGVAVTEWGEGFTVGTVYTAASTAQGQGGMPYTAFFYNDVRAAMNGQASCGWSTVMMNFAITGAFAGFEVGVSSLHTSVDIYATSTLAPETTLSCISFGGNWISGTYDASSSGLIVPLNVRSTDQNWSAFLHLPSSPNGCYASTDPNSGGSTHRYLKIYIGTDLYTIDCLHN
jgi:hypothetical protein